MRKLIYIVFVLSFGLQTIYSVPVRADDWVLPAPGTMIHLSPVYNPSVLKGLKVHPDNPFRLDFVLSKGDSSSDETNKLIKYFLAGLTIPEQDLWVNLSPYEKNRIVPEAFGQTQMGRDLLAEDYILKQISASLTYPQTQLGKQFWSAVYNQAKQLGTDTNYRVNMFNKVWIVPDKAVVYENAKAGTAYVVNSTLKVMLEEDYLALKKTNHRVAPQGISPASQALRQIIIPQLTKEVNEGKNFAQLRQVYNSLILAAWYKKKIKDSILAAVYENKNKTSGLVSSKESQKPEAIYQRYLEAFKKGAYNLIKEEPGSAATQRVPRKYFSGGCNLRMDAAMVESTDPALISLATRLPMESVQVDLQPDMAMSASMDAGQLRNLADVFLARLSRKNVLKIKLQSGQLKWDLLLKTTSSLIKELYSLAPNQRLDGNIPDPKRADKLLTRGDILGALPVNLSNLMRQRDMISYVVLNRLNIRLDQGEADHLGFEFLGFLKSSNSLKHMVLNGALRPEIATGLLKNLIIELSVLKPEEKISGQNITRADVLGSFRVDIKRLISSRKVITQIILDRLQHPLEDTFDPLRMDLLEGKTALITGGQASISPPIVQALLKRGMHLIILARDMSHYPEIAQLEGVTVINDYLSRGRRLAPLLASHNVDVVVHLAAHTLPRESEEVPAKYIDNNTIRTLELINDMKKTRAEVPYFIFISSTTVYGNQGNGKMLNENDEPVPQNPYSASKYNVERSLVELAQKYGIKYTVLRFPQIFGGQSAVYQLKGGQRRTRWVGDDHQDHLLPKMQATDNGREGRFEVFQNAILQPIALNQLGDWVGRSIARLMDGGSSAIFNIANTKPVSIQEIFETYERLVHPADSKPYAGPPVPSSVTLVDPNLATVELHMQASASMERMMRSALAHADWRRRHPQEVAQQPRVGQERQEWELMQDIYNVLMGRTGLRLSNEIKFANLFSVFISSLSPKFKPTPKFPEIEKKIYESGKDIHTISDFLIAVNEHRFSLQQLKAYLDLIDPARSVLIAEFKRTTQGAALLRQWLSAGFLEQVGNQTVRIRLKRGQKIGDMPPPAEIATHPRLQALLRYAEAEYDPTYAQRARYIREILKIVPQMLDSDFEHYQMLSKSEARQLGEYLKTKEEHDLEAVVKYASERFFLSRDQVLWVLRNLKFNGVGYIPTFDRNGNPTGKIKNSETLLRDRDWKEVSSVIFTTSQGTMLLQGRRSSGAHVGIIDAVGGVVGAGLDFKGAVHEHALNQIGFDLEEDKLIKLGDPFLFDRGIGAPIRDRDIHQYFLYPLNSIEERSLRENLKSRNALLSWEDAIWIQRNRQRHLSRETSFVIEVSMPMLNGYYLEHIRDNQGKLAEKGIKAAFAAGVFRRITETDSAQFSHVQGGIDLHAAGDALSNDSSAGIKFNINAYWRAHLESIDGFDPLIRNISPLKDLKAFLTAG